MSTKEIPGPFDGMERAAPDEPIFTLRAKDPLAPSLVREWVAKRREEIRIADLTDEKRELELLQCREAEDIAWAMEDWRAGETASAEPAKVNPNYSGNTMTDVELAVRQRFDYRRDTARRLDNAVAEIASVGENLTPEYQHLIFGLGTAINAAKEVADELRPKRKSYAHLEGELK